MQRDALLLIHMVEHARASRDAVARHGRPGFDDDVVVRMGFSHLLRVIGEAARLVPDETRARYAAVPWKQIVGMRHIIVHEYFRIDYDVVWNTATIHIPELLTALEPEIGPQIDQHQFFKSSP